MTTNPRAADYKNWSRDQLIERLIALEGPRSVNARAPSPTTATGPTRQSQPKEFNFASYAKRKIALKFCYSGWEYCGLAYQNGVTQLPTVEGVLFDAMAKAKLVDPSRGMEGCGWEKCGRTDRGVSAAGQVVSLWIRSAVGAADKIVEVEEKRKNLEEEQEVKKGEEDGFGAALDDFEDSGLPGLGEEDFGTLDLSQPSSPALASSKLDSKELDYVGILNRLLPPTIRILAWAPVAPTFSARFSCKYRHYKYFFSSHCLDISPMREAASRLVGEHDFRNLCKVDAQKQITMFKRVISRADIEPVDPNIVDSGRELGEAMYVFNLVGSAFLYHQVRHIMAILFLIGTGLEKPSLVTRLMNVTQGAEGSTITGEEDLEIVDRKPEYQMADGLPLMLWDCGYSEEDVEWRSGSLEYSPNDDTRRSGQGTETDLHHQLHSIWNRSRAHTVLDRHFLQVAERYHRPPHSILPLPSSTARTNTTRSAELVGIQDVGGPINYPLGGGTYKRALKYVRVLERNRLDTVELINERWRLGKGLRRAERRGDNSNGNDEEEGDEGDE